MNSSLQSSEGALQAPRRVTARVLAVAIALILSIGLNVLLSYKLQGLNNARSARAADRSLKVGAVVPTFTAQSLTGRQEVISYENSDEPTVLYVFTPPCIWCARNLDNFKTVLEKGRGHYRFIGLSLSQDALNEYVVKNELNLPVYTGLSVETRKSYMLSGTPQTIVVSSEGRVLHSWRGAYVGEQKAEVEEYFHVSLPGLKPAPTRGSASSSESSKNTTDQPSN